jgi:hypothetical protein
MPHTLLDIAKANGVDPFTKLVDESLKAHPEMSEIESERMSGRLVKTLVRTALGATTGGFRAANAGVAAVKHVYETRMVECYILEARVQEDVGVADGYEKGPAAWLELQAGGSLEGEMQGLCKQFYYGAGNNAAGHPGLIQGYDATNMVVDAGGTTASTGSSVWLIRQAPENVRWRWGDNGQFSFGPAMKLPVVDPNDSTKSYMAYIMALLAYPGLQFNNLQAVCRIKKITADAGKTLTDKLLSQAMTKFPAGRGPTVCFMTLRSLQQLQDSRTATNPTGAPAPWPTSIQGADGTMIPIKVTDAISNTESLTL